MPTRKRRVFVSFDFDNDQALYNLIIGQTRLQDSPFDVADWSLKEAAPQATWAAEAKSKIQRSDTVVVMIGTNTYRAPGVLKEVAMANELNKHIFQVIGYSNLISPPSVRGAGQMYRWNWPNLKVLLAPVQY